MGIKIVEKKLIFIIFSLFIFCTIFGYFWSSISNKVVTTLNISHRTGIDLIFEKKVNFDELMQQQFSLRNFFDNQSDHGLPFNKKWNVYLKDLNLLDVKNIDDEAILRSEPVIGTALSSNHFREFLNLMDSLASVYGNEKNKISVYVYDLGLREREKKMLMAGYSDLIQEIRTFAFGKYPPYFKKLNAFRWKPVIVAELLKQFPSMWWMDASIVVYKPLSVFYPDIHRCSSNVSECAIYPWSLINDEGLSIWAGTDNRTYRFLPMNEDLAKNITMYAATVQLIFATKEVRENVLRYWVLCAFEEECMEPKDSHTGCHWNGYHVFGGDTYTIHGGCNLQDQSAINIILARVSNFNITHYYRNFKGTVEIHRS